MPFNRECRDVYQGRLERQCTRAIGTNTVPLHGREEEPLPPLATDIGSSVIDICGESHPQRAHTNGGQSILAPVAILVSSPTAHGCGLAIPRLVSLRRAERGFESPVVTYALSAEPRIAATTRQTRRLKRGQRRRHG